MKTSYREYVSIPPIGFSGRENIGQIMSLSLLELLAKIKDKEKLLSYPLFSEKLPSSPERVIRKNKTKMLDELNVKTDLEYEIDKEPLEHTCHEIEENIDCKANSNYIDINMENFKKILSKTEIKPSRYKKYIENLADYKSRVQIKRDDNYTNIMYYVAGLNDLYSKGAKVSTLATGEDILVRYFYNMATVLTSIEKTDVIPNEILVYPVIVDNKGKISKYRHENNSRKILEKMKRDKLSRNIYTISFLGNHNKNIEKGNIEEGYKIKNKIMSIKNFFDNHAEEYIGTRDDENLNKKLKNEIDEFYNDMKTWEELTNISKKLNWLTMEIFSRNAIPSIKRGLSKEESLRIEKEFYNLYSFLRY